MKTLVAILIAWNILLTAGLGYFWMKTTVLGIAVLEMGDRVDHNFSQVDNGLDVAEQNIERLFENDRALRDGLVELSQSQQNAKIQALLELLKLIP